MNNQNKKIAINSVIIFIRLCVVSIVSLISARFILQALGTSDYGLYNVVGGIVNLLNILNAAMITTTYRYIAFELGKTRNVNKIFNASFRIHFFLALLIFVVGLGVGTWYVNNYLNIPNDKFSDAIFVLWVSTFTAMVTTILVPFQGLLTAYEKFNVSACFDIFSQLLKLGLVIVLVHITVNKIRVYSLIMLLYFSVYALLFFIYSFKKYREDIRIKSYHSKELYREMASFTGWVLLGAGASSGQVQGSAMIINYFFGTIANAAFAVANQVMNFVNMFAGNLGQAAVPQITKSFSGGDSERSVNLACYISKYTYILMALVAFPLFIETDFILSIWLKEVPDGASVMCKLTLLNGLLCCLGAGTPALIQATGKLKPFQIFITTTSLMSLPVAIIAYKLGYPVYSILVIYCVSSVVIAIGRLVLLKAVIKFDIKKFIYISYLKIFYITVPLVVFYIFYNPTHFTLTGHLLGLMSSVLFFVLTVCLLGLEKQEYAIIKDTLYSKICRKRQKENTLFE